MKDCQFGVSPVNYSDSDSDQRLSNDIDQTEPSIPTALPPKYIWNVDRKQIFIENIQVNLQQISEEIQNAIANNVSKLPLNLLMNAIYGAAKTMKKTTNARNRGTENVSQNKAWFDTECENLRKKAIRALRNFRIVQTPQALDSYKHDKSEYKELIKRKKSKYALERGHRLSEAAQAKNPKVFWNFLKADRKAPDSKIKLDDWFEHFSSILNPQQINNFENVDFEPEGELHENGYLDGAITESEILYAMKNLKIGKSPGIDGLTIQFLKACSAPIVPYLSTLFNFYFEHSFFPAEWSMSILCPIHKKGETDDPNNFRGVSLLSEISKNFTFILNRRLKAWSEANEIISNIQLGFREQHTTIDQIFCLYTLRTKYLRHKGGRFYTLFVDFEKAFDRVDRTALWHKLISQNVSSKMVQMLKAIYADVKVCVKSSEGLSEMISCPVGVKQGCIISPILYTLFLNDIRDEIAEGSHGIDIGTIKLFVLLFADNLVIFAETVIELQRLINRLADYCARWHINVNQGSKCPSLPGLTHWVNSGLPGLGFKPYFGKVGNTGE